MTVTFIAKKKHFYSHFANFSQLGMVAFPPPPQHEIGLKDSKFILTSGALVWVSENHIPLILLTAGQSKN